MFLIVECCIVMSVMSLLIEILAGRDGATHSVGKSEATVFVPGQQPFRNESKQNGDG